MINIKIQAMQLLNNLIHNQTREINRVSEIIVDNIGNTEQVEKAKLIKLLKEAGLSTNQQEYITARTKSILSKSMLRRQISTIMHNFKNRLPGNFQLYKHFIDKRMIVPRDPSSAVIACLELMIYAGLSRKQQETLLNKLHVCYQDQIVFVPSTATERAIVEILQTCSLYYNELTTEERVVRVRTSDLISRPEPSPTFDSFEEEVEEEEENAEIYGNAVENTY